MMGRNENLVSPQSINPMVSPQPLRILVSNDDGIFAMGIRTLANTLAAKGHQVTVVCPDKERSATGHSLTIHEPIRIEPVDGLFSEGVKAWACSGNPSDCVKLALTALLDEKPDLVVSGINHGPNLGNDTIYSGTVSAAMEGLMEGVTSIAFSLASYTDHRFNIAAECAHQVITHIYQQNLPASLFNVNIPAVDDITLIKGIQLTRLGLRRYIDSFTKRVDPRGKTYYWLAGEAIEDLEQPHHPSISQDIPIDVLAIKQNYITITPLDFNLTALHQLDDYRDRFEMDLSGEK
jgi:5'-nucleotidase